MRFKIVEAQVPKTFYKKVDGKKVYIVDGNYIRTNLEKEFTNFSQHYEYPNLIPQNEIWVDKEAAPGDIDYYIIHAITEHERMAEGEDFDNAHEEGKSAEITQRRKTMRRKEDVRIKLWKKLEKSKIKIFIVDGEAVRNQYNVDFTEGGHWLVYDFIPKGEVWLDNDIQPKERKWILAHEVAEMKLMKNFKLSYEQAHKEASKYEQKLRKENNKNTK